MSSLPIDQQRGFLESCLEPMTVVALRAEVKDDSDMFGPVGSCLAALEGLVK